MTSPPSALPAWGLQSKVEANKKNVVSGLGDNPVNGVPCVLAHQWQHLRGSDI